MARWPWDKYGDRTPQDELEAQLLRQRCGPPNFWGGNVKIPDALAEWTRTDPLAGALARRFLEEYPDTGKISDRPRWFTGHSFKGYGPHVYQALLSLGLLEEKKSVKHGGTYAVPAHHLYAWLSLATHLHPQTTESPCLSRSTLATLPVISPATLKVGPPAAPPSPPLL